MSDFRVITDGSADLPDEVISARDIQVVPFYVMMGDALYRKQGVEVSTGEFYDWMVATPGKFPKSSAPSAQDYYAAFEPAVKAGEKVICICITDKFSCSFQSASIAKEMIMDAYPDAKLHVMNSRVNTVLQGQIVMEACDLRDAGVSFDKAISELEDLKYTGRIFFTIGGIEYLQIGGRIGKLAGKVSAVLGIRPIITLSEGEIHPSGVCRGRGKSLDKVLSVAKSYLESSFKSGDELSISVGYGYDRQEAESFRDSVQQLLDSLKLKCPLPIYRIGAVIGVHTGPHPLGVGVVRRARV